MERKECITCKKKKPLTEYSTRPYAHGRIGHFNECKRCKSDRSAKRYADPKLRKRMNAAVSEWFKTKGRFSKYGLSPEQYKQLLADSGGCCALCGTDQPGGKGTWHIDHIGGTVREKFIQCEAHLVRGILCHRCNVSLGHWENMIERLGKDRIDQYLLRPSPFAKESEP
jgi:hypothetical protein